MKNLVSQEKIYDELYGTKKFANMDIPDKKIISGQNVANKKIVVLGIGAGRDIRYLTRKNEVWGVDISRNALKIVKNYGIRTIKADLNKPLNLKGNSFDIVVAKDILEHLENPSLLMNEIFRILKPSGYAVIDVPNHFFLPMRLRILFGKNLIWKTFFHNHTIKFDEWNYMHRTFFTWKGFNKFLIRHNFKISKSFWDFGTLNHYSQPEMILSYIGNRENVIFKRFVTPSIKVMWLMFNYIFPRKVRSSVVALSPSLLCASFYVWCKPIKE